MSGLDIKNHFSLTNFITGEIKMRPKNEEKIMNDSEDAFYDAEESRRNDYNSKEDLKKIRNNIQSTTGKAQEVHLLTAYREGKSWLKEMAESKDDKQIEENQRLAAAFLYLAAHNGNGLPLASVLYGCLLSKGDDKSLYKSEAETYFKPARKWFNKPNIDDLYTLAISLSYPKYVKKNDASEELVFTILRHYIQFTNNATRKQEAISHLEEIGFRYLTESDARDKNEVKAANYCYVAAKEGSINASFYYAYLLHEKNIKSELHEIKRSEYEEVANAYYKKIRGSESKKKQLHPGYLAMMYYFGWGGVAMLKEAITNFAIASKKYNHAPSQYMLAKIYYLESTKNSRDALKYCENALEYCKKAIENIYENTEKTQLLRKNLFPETQNKESMLNLDWFDDVHIMASVAVTSNANVQLIDLIEKLPFPKLSLQQIHHEAFHSSVPDTPLFLSIYKTDIDKIKMLLPFCTVELKRIYGIVLAAASESVHKDTALELLLLVDRNENRLLAARALAKRLKDFFAGQNDSENEKIYKTAEQVLEEKVNISFNNQKTVYHKLMDFTDDLLKKLKSLPDKTDGIKQSIDLLSSLTAAIKSKDSIGLAQLLEHYYLSSQVLKNAKTVLRAFKALTIWLNLSLLSQSETLAWLKPCLTAGNNDMETVQKTIKETLDCLSQFKPSHNFFQNTEASDNQHKYELLAQKLRKHSIEIGRVIKQAVGGTKYDLAELNKETMEIHRVIGKIMPALPDILKEEWEKLLPEIKQLHQTSEIKEHDNDFEEPSVAQLSTSRKNTTLANNPSNFWSAFESLAEIKSIETQLAAEIAEKVRKSALNSGARQYGYTFNGDNTPPDGSCFFHAVLDQLTRNNYDTRGLTAAKLRQMAVGFIMANRTRYEGYLDQETDGTFKEFIKNAREYETWANHLLIDALSRSLKITIVVIRSDGQKPNIFVSPGSSLTIYLGYELEIREGKEVGIHFLSARRLSLEDLNDSSEEKTAENTLGVIGHARSGIIRNFK